MARDDVSQRELEAARKRHEAERAAAKKREAEQAAAWLKAEKERKK